MHVTSRMDCTSTAPVVEELISGDGLGFLVDTKQHLSVSGICRREVVGASAITGIALLCHSRRLDPFSSRVGCPCYQYYVSRALSRVGRVLSFGSRFHWVGRLGVGCCYGDGGERGRERCGFDALRLG